MKRFTHNLSNLPLSKALAIALGFGICALVIYNSRDMIFGTPLAISAATDGATVESPFFPISGTARHARELSVNGRPISIDRKGNFTDEVILSPGYNIVEVALRDQFGKQKVKTYHVVVSQSDTVATTLEHPYQ